MLVRTINTAYEFEDAMEDAGRNYYSHEGYSWMLDLFDDLGEPVEFDPIGICGDFNEEDRGYFIKAYNLEEELETPAEDITDDDIENYVNYRSMGTVLENGNVIWMTF